ncbi:organic cation transporter protein-like [Mytilus galloprovincialis]|uniref:organic cation transporter protein-like n=1 Tax=Mytilus galloprovincialis TaxID=29158 RepID=UPI003F7C0655
MKFDDILSDVGDFGWYQKRNFILLIIGWTLTAPFMVLSVFVLAMPEHRCKLPGYDNDTYAIQSDTHQLLLDEYIPLSSDSEHLYDQCHVYQIDQYNTVFDNHSHPVNSSILKCSEWVYSSELFDYTFVMKENLVCDNKYKISLSKTIFFGGVLVGSFMFGIISDTIGRRKTLLIATLFLFASGLTLAWSQSYTMFVILRFCTGFCNVGMFITIYVIAMEWVGPSKRMLVGLVIHLVGPTGELYMLAVAYFVRTWNWIIIAMVVPIGLFTVLWWFIPESPRWLCGKGKLKEAKNLLRCAAKVNKTTFSEKMVDNLPVEKKEAGKVWLLFTDRTLGCRTLVIFYNWMVASMVFYGLTLNTGMLYGDYYINYMLVVLVEYPGHILTLLMVDRYGRRKSHFIYMLVGGVSCLSTIFTVTFGGKDLQSLTTALAMLGKLFATAAFATIYIISAELFPTAIRNAGMGSSSLWARVGGMISPFIADTADLIGGTSGKAIPLVIFGAASLVAAGLTLTLPETLNRQLPETIEDGKNFTKKAYKEKEKAHELIIKEPQISIITKL